MGMVGHFGCAHRLSLGDLDVLVGLVIVVAVSGRVWVELVSFCGRMSNDFDESAARFSL